MRSVRLDEPTEHDRWQIRGDDRGARADGKGKTWRPRHCRACDAEATHGTYCKKHWQRVQNGTPVDIESYPTEADFRRLSTGLCWGYRPAPARAKGGR